MKLRVMLLTTTLERGGAELQVVQLGSELARRGWDTRVVSLRTGWAGPEPCPPWHAVGAPGPLALPRLLTLLRRFRPHVLHAHLFHANITARALRLVCPAPVVISTIHSIAETPRGSERIRCRDLAYRLTDALADATVCVSKAAAERHLTTHAVGARRLHVIPNGVDTARFHPDPSRRAPASGEEFVWLAAGRLMWKKDYPTLLRAMAQQRGSVLLIAGAGPQEEELKALARELGANVRFLGVRQDMPALLQEADGFVLSSLVEGLPMALLEAAAAGVPTVTTDAGGAREIVLDGRTGFVVPASDASALAAAMTRLSALPPPERAGMGCAAREHACAHFDLPVIAGLWEKLYRELLEAAARKEHEWM